MFLSYLSREITASDNSIRAAIISPDYIIQNDKMSLAQIERIPTRAQFLFICGLTIEIPNLIWIIVVVTHNAEIRNLISILYHQLAEMGKTEIVVIPISVPGDIPKKNAENRFFGLSCKRRCFRQKTGPEPVLIIQFIGQMDVSGRNETEIIITAFLQREIMKLTIVSVRLQTTPKTLTRGIHFFRHIP